MKYCLAISFMSKLSFKHKISMNSAAMKVPGSPIGSTGSVNRSKSLASDFNQMQSSSTTGFNGGTY